MNAGARFWVRVGAGTALALALAIAFTPASPPARVPWPAAIAAGLGAGIALFVMITRARPRAPSLAFGRLAFLGLWAANEEVIWRRLALGELLGLGLAPALAASSAGFALAHRSRRAVHLGTGAAFGAVYIATGALAAPVAAHWAYNALVSRFVAAPEGPG